MSKDLPVLSDTCTGCAACANACPRHAISMVRDGDGFLRPEVDADACIGCGLCMRTCPDLKQPGPPRPDLPPAYAAWSLDDAEHLGASSGGVFPVLAKRILAEHGCVVGAIMDDGLQIRHAFAQTPEELAAMRGSKYGQSTVGEDVFRQVKAMLKEGRKVLFSGTPCQVAGLKSYLGMLAGSGLLLTVDVVCHGVPSRKILDAYIRYRESQLGEKVTSWEFRDKRELQWEHFALTCTTGSGKSTSTWHQQDYFMRGFLSNMGLNRSCYSCRYASATRVGDITLGDFWGIGLIRPDISRAKGVSLVFLNTQKGQAAFDAARPALECHLVDTQEVLDKGQPFMKPMEEPRPRKAFLDAMGTTPFPMVIDQYTKGCAGKREIALIGCWYTDNYGAVLTGYSLYRQVCNMRKDIVMVGMEYYGTCPKKDVIVHPFLKAERVHNIILSSTQEYAGLNDRFSTYLVGSDQLWSKYFLDHTYYLDFARGDKKKVAYGTSLGAYENPYSREYESRARLLLHRFDAISSREKYAPDILKERFGVEAEYVLDPVFLTKKEEWEELAQKSTRELPEGEYAATYILDPTPQLRESILAFSQASGLPLANIVDSSNDAKADKLGLPGTLRDVSLHDWLRVFSRSSCIVTDSFHGVCFAIILRKPFICIANVDRGLARIHSLFETFQLPDRLAYNKLAPEAYPVLRRPLDGDAIQAVLDRMRESSLAWLQHALEAPRDPSFVLASLNTDEILRQSPFTEPAPMQLLRQDCAQPAAVQTRKKSRRFNWTEKNDTRLLGFLPLFRVMKNASRCKVLLFNFIPLLKVKIKPQSRLYLLFGFLPVLRRKFRSRA